MILFSCCIFLEKSWVHNTTQQLLVLGTQHQLMKLWMLVVGYTTTNCTKVGCWVHNNQQISDVVLCCVGSCWYNPCLNQADCKYFLLQDLDEVSVMREQLAETNAQVARLQAINAEANTKIENLTQTLLLMEKRLTLVENQLKVTVGN